MRHVGVLNSSAYWLFQIENDWHCKRLGELTYSGYTIQI